MILHSNICNINILVNILKCCKYEIQLLNGSLMYNIHAYPQQINLFFVI